MGNHRQASAIMDGREQKIKYLKEINGHYRIYWTLLSDWLTLREQVIKDCRVFLSKHCSMSRNLLYRKKMNIKYFQFKAKKLRCFYFRRRDRGFHYGAYSRHWQSELESVSQLNVRDKGSWDRPL